MGTADRLARVAQRVAARGRTIVEVPGWRTRGKGTLTPHGHLDHHTAGPRTGDTPSLRVVTFGRPDLRNALCCWYVSRAGVAYLVAARVSWHAGRGVHGSNSTLSGTEAEHSGSPDEPWGEQSLLTQAVIDAEMAAEFGFAALPNVWDHREHAPGRKIDRTGIDSHAWRRRVLATIAPKEWDEMASKDEIAAVVRTEVDAALQRWQVGTSAQDQAPVQNRIYGADVKSSQAIGLLERIARKLGA